MMWPDARRQPLYAALVVILLLGAIAWEVSAVAGRMRQFRTIGDAPLPPRQIIVSGEGKVRATPDVAVVTAGFTVSGSNVRTVQDEANRKTTALIDAVKAAGVAAADIQTSEFSAYPQYAYEEQETPRVSGYEARQSVEIRIRDLDRVNEVLGVVGEAGATNIGNLQFTIDDPAALRAQARAEAIAKARQEAQRIADALGVNLGRPITFNESSGGISPPYLARAFALEAGIGGAVEAPTIERGTNEVTASVTVTYELR